jgi:hypothetical protein
MIGLCFPKVLFWVAVPAWRVPCQRKCFYSAWQWLGGRAQIQSSCSLEEVRLFSIHPNPSNRQVL